MVLGKYFENKIKMYMKDYPNPKMFVKHFILKKFRNI